MYLQYYLVFKYLYYIPDRILLRRFLKCMYNDVKETKKIIELNFSIRNRNPHIFLHRDPADEAVKAIQDVV